jgi:hypothetical protein
VTVGGTFVPSHRCSGCGRRHRVNSKRYNVDFPVPQLDEEGIKEKKKQKLMKAGFDARARARREKEKEREEKEAEGRREEEERENNFDDWAARLRREQEVWYLPSACLDALSDFSDQ